MPRLARRHPPDRRHRIADPRGRGRPHPPTSAMRRLLARHLQGLLLLLVQGGKISGRTAHASPHVHAKSLISAWLSLVLEKSKMH